MPLFLFMSSCVSGCFVVSGIRAFGQGSDDRSLLLAMALASGETACFYGRQVVREKVSKFHTAHDMSRRLNLGVGWSHQKLPLFEVNRREREKQEVVNVDLDIHGLRLQFAMVKTLPGHLSRRCEMLRSVLWPSHTADPPLFFCGLTISWRP